MDRINQSIEDFEFDPSQMGFNQRAYRSLLNDDNDDIVEIEPIQEVINNKLIQEIDNRNKENLSISESKKILSDIQSNIESEKKEISKKTREEIIENNNDISDIIENATGLKMPEDIDAIETAEVLEDVKELKLDFNEVTIERVPEKSPLGFWKASVISDPGKMPSKVHKLSREIINISGGVIQPRICDLRTITNTNKIQLRNSAIKLSGKCVTYRPKNQRRSTRVIISIPDSGDSWFIYLSEIRNHRIYEIKDAEKHIEWISKRVLDFFNIGMEMTSWKIRLREVDSPMMKITDDILRTGKYHAKPCFNKEGDKISHVIFCKKDTQNTWLRIALICKYPHYVVEGFTSSGRPTESAYFDIHLTKDYNKNKYNIQEIDKYLLSALDNCFDKKEEDWYDAMGLGIDAIASDPKILLHRLGIMKGKLTFKPLKKSFENIIDFMEDEIDNGRKVGIYIDKVLEKDKLLKASKGFKKSKIGGDLIGESIIGGTDKVEFILTYMLLFLNQGDKRVSSEYITSQRYYQVSGVKDRRSPQLRKLSLAGKGQDRNYNAVEYVFMLEYKSKLNGKESTYIAKTFDEVLEKTMFLTDKPKFNVPTQFDKYL